jgi:hypothetical protein
LNKKANLRGGISIGISGVARNFQREWILNFCMKNWGNVVDFHCFFFTKNPSKLKVIFFTEAGGNLIIQHPDYVADQHKLKC